MTTVEVLGSHLREDIFIQIDKSLSYCCTMNGLTLESHSRLQASL